MTAPLIYENNLIRICILTSVFIHFVMMKRHIVELTLCPDVWTVVDDCDAGVARVSWECGWSCKDKPNSCKSSFEVA